MNGHARNEVPQEARFVRLFPPFIFEQPQTLHKLTMDPGRLDSLLKDVLSGLFLEVLVWFGLH